VGGLSAGGAVANGGAATLVDSTFSGNSAIYGGGIGNIRLLTLDNCTISGNSAAIGGGVSNYTGSGKMTGTTTTHDTLIAQNTASSDPDVDGRFQSQGYNLIGDGTGGSGFVRTDRVGTATNPIDPMLGPLAANGGLTPTMALLPGSPAINAGDNTGAPDTDQRGFPRIVGGTIDIGAFELQPADQATHLAFNGPTSITAGTPFAITVTALDDLGQQATGFTDPVHFTASNGAMATYTFTPADMGSHTFTVTFTRAQALTVTGSSTLNPPVTGSTTFTIAPAAAAHVAFSVPSTITAGVPFAITVTIQDAYSNTVTGYTGRVQFAASNGQSAAYTFTAADMGSHTFHGVVLNQPGTYTVTGTDTMDPSLTGSITFTVG
jgi:hypothetical protein